MKQLTKQTSVKAQPNPFLVLVRELVKNKGCRFVQLHYTAKGTGEEATHTLCLGVDLERAYRRDEKVTRLFKPSNKIEEQAKEAVLTSLRESITKGIGNNSAYTCKGVFETIAPGLKIHEDGTLHVYGFVIRKEVITPGVYKSVNSADLTIAKDKVKKNHKLRRFRQFILTNINEARINGKTLVLG